MSEMKIKVSDGLLNAIYEEMLMEGMALPSFRYAERVGKAASIG